MAQPNWPFAALPNEIRVLIYDVSCMAQEHGFYLILFIRLQMCISSGSDEPVTIDVLPPDNIFFHCT